MGILSRLFILIHWLSFLSFLITLIILFSHIEFMQSMDKIFYQSYLLSEKLTFNKYGKIINNLIVTGFWLFSIMPVLIWVLFNKIRVLPSIKPLTKTED